MDGKMTWDEHAGFVPAYDDAVIPKDYPPGIIILASENQNNSGIPGTWKKINEVWEKQPEED